MFIIVILPTGRCLQRKDSGPCEALSYQFFFNQTSDRCDVFNYGGCQGNRNRFPTGVECASACNPNGKGAQVGVAGAN